jgi:exodeoxyribonuclease VII large subunit
VLARKGAAATAETQRATTLERLRIALDAHDPSRTLERGYALVEDGAGALVTSAAAARRAGAVRLRFADAGVDATITEP